MRITDYKNAAVQMFKSRPHSPPVVNTRSGYTSHFDTRFVTEPLPDIPKNPSYLAEPERFRTVQRSALMGLKDPLQPQVADAMKNAAQRQFKEQRARNREAQLEAAKQAGEAAVLDFDKRRIARLSLRSDKY